MHLAAKPGRRGFDVRVIGPVTRDHIRVGAGRPREVPGGVAHRVGWLLRRLGLETTALANAARRDAPARR